MAKSMQKPKKAPGTRNAERRNGKAWKLRQCGKRHAPGQCPGKKCK